MTYISHTRRAGMILPKNQNDISKQLMIMFLVQHQSSIMTSRQHMTAVTSIGIALEIERMERHSLLAYCSPRHAAPTSFQAMQFDNIRNLQPQLILDHQPLFSASFPCDNTRIFHLTSHLTTSLSPPHHLLEVKALENSKSIENTQDPSLSRLVLIPKIIGPVIPIQHHLQTRSPLAIKRGAHPQYQVIVSRMFLHTDRNIICTRPSS